MKTTPRRCHPGVLPLLACAVLAGCVGGVSNDQAAWQGELIGGPGGLTGSIAALSQSIRTHASVGIQRGTPGQRYAWRLERGTCQNPGAILGAPGAYPILTAGDDGSAQADGYISQTLDSGPYTGRVLLVAADGTQTSAACADLERLN